MGLLVCRNCRQPEQAPWHRQANPFRHSPTKTQTLKPPFYCVSFFFFFLKRQSMFFARDSEEKEQTSLWNGKKMTLTRGEFRQVVHWGSFQWSFCIVKLYELNSWQRNGENYLVSDLVIYGHLQKLVLKCKEEIKKYLIWIRAIFRFLFIPLFMN